MDKTPETPIGPEIPKPLKNSKKQVLRQVFREKRQQLSQPEQDSKAKALLSVLKTLPEFAQSQKIAVYWPMEGEISPIPFLAYALETGKACYLPVLHPLDQKQLWFVAYKPQDLLTPNRFGILEPSLDATKLIPARSLDLVFVPLVAFDDRGQRLGMGQGYYDRTFAFLKDERLSKPYFIGLAYEFQQVSSLPSEDWDIPLRGIVTEKRLIKTVG